MYFDFNFNSYIAYTPDDFRTIASQDHTAADAIWVGTGGDIVLVGGDGAVPTTFKSVPSGTLLPVRAYKILAAGTTASNIVILYRTLR